MNDTERLERLERLKKEAIEIVNTSGNIDPSNPYMIIATLLDTILKDFNGDSESLDELEKVMKRDLQKFKKQKKVLLTMKNVLEQLHSTMNN